MIIKQCTSCGKHSIHNEMAKKPNEDQRYRCTYCGFPVTTNPHKREFAESVRLAQVKKAGKL